MSFYQITLHYRNITVYKDARFGKSTGQVLMDNMRCAGTETDIALCNFNGWGKSSCGHDDDVGVSCGKALS